MKILILTNSFGGLQHFRKEVVIGLKHKGNEMVISAPSGEGETYFKDIGCETVGIFFNRKGKNPLKDIGLLFRYIKLIKKTKPDVVLSYTIKPNVFGGMACQLYGIPQIANVTGLGSAVERPGWLQILTTHLYKVGLRKAHLVFFQNKTNMEFCLLRKMVKGNTRVIPGSGVNIKEHNLQDYPALEEPMRFLFIGRLLKAKGIEEYLAAAQEIRRKYPNTEFHILGRCEDEYARKMEKLQKDSYVVYHGHQMDVRPYIGQAWCIIHPSYYPEGMSNVLLESCAAGRPIITTDRPGCREIVEDGVNGFVVKQRDAHDVILKIEQFIALPHEKKCEMGLAARRKVEREFDRNIVVKAYLEEISRIM